MKKGHSKVEESGEEAESKKKKIVKYSETKHTRNVQIGKLITM